MTALRRSFLALAAIGTLGGILLGLTLHWTGLVPALVLGVALAIGWDDER